MVTEAFEHRWKAANWILLMVIFVDVSAIVIGVIFQMLLNDPLPLVAGLGVIVIVTILGTLMGFNRLSESPDLTKGEMRKSIAITIIILYLLVIILAITTQLSLENDQEKLVIDNFSNVVIAVIIFYFGSRTAQTFFKLRNGTATLQTLSEAVGEYEKSAKDLSIAKGELKKLEDGKKGEAEIKAAKAKVEQLQTQFDELSKQQDNAKQDLKEEQGKLKKLEDGKKGEAEIKAAKAKVEQLQTQFDELSKQRKETDAARITAGVGVETLTQEITKGQAETKEAAAKVEQVQAKVDIMLQQILERNALAKQGEKRVA